jgi:protocatechuate 3,4-dioxygenase beta subunit
MLGLEVKMAQVRPDGSYEFPGLAPGAYQFNFGGVQGGGDAQMRVTVPDLPEYKCDLALPEGRIAGRVIAREGGAPVRSAQVLLRSKADRAPTGLLAQLIGGEGRGERAFTQDDGSFEFDRVAPGAYALEVQPPRWGDDRGKYAPRTGDSIDVADGEVRTDLELALSPSWAIRGRISGDGGQPLKGATVLAYARATPELEPSRAVSNAAGEFELLSLAEGRHELLVWADGYAEKRLADIRSSQGAQSIEIALERGVEVRVRALDASGRPLAGAVAKLVPVDSSSGVGSDARRAIGGFLKGQGMSGLDGWMELGRCMPGRYRIEASRGALRGVLEEVSIDGYATMESSITLK